MLKVPHLSQQHAADLQHSVFQLQLRLFHTRQGTILAFLGGLRLVHTDCVKHSRVGQFNAHVKCAQIENSLSYCVLRSELRRSERAFSRPKERFKLTLPKKSEVNGEVLRFRFIILSAGPLSHPVQSSSTQKQRLRQVILRSEFELC